MQFCQLVDYFYASVLLYVSDEAKMLELYHAVLNFDFVLII